MHVCSVVLILYQIKNTRKMTTTAQILNQLGGNKFIAMTGATCYSDNNGNTLVAKFKGSRIANIMYVTLNENDTYDVKICKYKNLDVKVIKAVTGAYAEMLKPLFETTTGLRTSL
jgi:stage III sporulation protein SpoIIIAA